MGSWVVNGALSLKPASVTRIEVPQPLLRAGTVLGVSLPPRSIRVDIK